MSLGFFGFYTDCLDGSVFDKQCCSLDSLLQTRAGRLGGRIQTIFSISAALLVFLSPSYSVSPHAALVTNKQISGRA